MKDLLVSLFLTGLALVLYSHLINKHYDIDSGSYPAASWNYKEKMASYEDRERSFRQVFFSEDDTRGTFR